MRFWVSVLTLLLLLAGCSKEEKKEVQKVTFSVLIPKPVGHQAIHYAEGMGLFTSKLPHSVVSAMVINNPIQADKEAVIAVAVENLDKKEVPLTWDAVTFFHPKNVIKLLPINKIPDYFSKPDHCKPLLGRRVYESQLLRYGVVSEMNGTQTKTLTPSEKALARIYRDVKKDVCYARIPDNSTLRPHEVKVGYLVIELPKEHFIRRTLFMLKIPVGSEIHKLRFALQPLD